MPLKAHLEELDEETTMLLRKHLKNPTTMMSLGMYFLVTGSLSLHFLPRWTHLPSSVTDGMGGLFYGLAIGCLLVGIRARRAR